MTEYGPDDMAEFYRYLGDAHALLVAVLEASSVEEMTATANRVGEKADNPSGVAFCLAFSFVDYLKHCDDTDYVSRLGQTLTKMEMLPDDEENR